MSVPGFGPFFQAQPLEDDRLVPARVVATNPGSYDVLGCRASRARLSGALQHGLDSYQRPTTGDYVGLLDDDDEAVIHHVYDRRTLLSRRAIGRKTHPQVVAANVDTFFIVTAADRDFSLRRLERYLASVWDSGAEPVIVLNKVDLVTEPEVLVEEIQTVAVGAPVLGLSAHTEDGLGKLQGCLQSGQTYGFIGSSGVGKSTLVNLLYGSEIQATSQVGSADRGRHTTTRRELFVLPNGALVIDTPGMRELGLFVGQEAVEQAFADIVELAQNCRFNDCKHESEPGCAVRAALENGTLAEDRFESYLSLQAEQASLRMRSDPVEGANTKRRWKEIHKEMRRFSKKNPKRKR